MWTSLEHYQILGRSGECCWLSKTIFNGGLLLAWICCADVGGAGHSGSQSLLIGEDLLNSSVFDVGPECMRLKTCTNESLDARPGGPKIGPSRDLA